MVSGVPLRQILQAKSSQISERMYELNLVRVIKGTAVTLVAMALTSCNSAPKDGAEAQTRPRGAERNQAIAVDVAIAATAPLETVREYTGTTQPVREVAIRAQAEGQLQQLNVDVGDRVKQGQVLAQIDDAILSAQTAEAQAELASRRTEIVQLEAQVSDAKTQVAQNRYQLQQAQSDAARYASLAKSGAVSKQQAEQFRTQANTAAQVLQSAQAKVRAQQQAIIVARSRIAAQQAVVAQQQRRRGYAVVAAPISGAVLTRSTERGNLVQVGNELLRLGDFSQAKVNVQVSELDLAKVRLNGTANIKLDAFPKEQFRGTVTRISPAANPTSRLIPVEITIPNPTGKVGSGLLARATFTQTTLDRVVIPLSALQDDRANTKSPQPNPNSSQRAPTPSTPRTNGTLFVITRQGEQTKVTPRTVTLGQQIDGKVQILSGLNPGERFVSRASRPLKDGQPVRLSILSAK
ncbi:efflux RND transporter periplasmic adaptor subunit [Chamaesiphon minutus]|uniref:Multidrug resistance efflux pump n=1 Tax=Chamaesiphon minutus (strain ATCC 27169 / PCC 6605) TaxID=1173020 RepID=K9UJQ2_CHAP6|nr:efflux RND transporter periplasmic adaptor subunit [Chamaesiphon minutus]AFY94878.1 multidrug resistance efflux pump [Chamaesiphon minutus PCC 6605]